MGMILRIASSRIVGQGDIVGRSGYFSLNLSANSVMRGRLDARRTLKSLVADLRISIGGKDDMQYVEHAKMHELYLQIPVMVAARLPLGENYHASLGLGPYIACGVGGKTSGSIKQDYAHSGHDGYYRFRTSTFGSVLENKAGNRRLDGGVIIEIAFEYRRFIIGAEAQVGLVKVNQQLRQVIETEEFQGYLPKNFASFFTIGYKFR